jgi:hypothetical protein
MLLSANKVIEAGSILQEGMAEFLFIFYAKCMSKRGIVVFCVANKDEHKGR